MSELKLKSKGKGSSYPVETVEVSMDASWLVSCKLKVCPLEIGEERGKDDRDDDLKGREGVRGSVECRWGGRDCLCSSYR